MKAIVYTSNTGSTQEYANLLGESIHLPVYSLSQAMTQLDEKSEIIYMGWIMAGMIKGYSDAVKRFDVKAVCGVGMNKTGANLEMIRAQSQIPENVALFTLQGAYEPKKIKGVSKLLVSMVVKKTIKDLEQKANRTDDDNDMLEFLKTTGSRVSSKNLNDVIAWYDTNK